MAIVNPLPAAGGVRMESEGKTTWFTLSAQVRRHTPVMPCHSPGTASIMTSLSRRVTIVAVKLPGLHDARKAAPTLRLARAFRLLSTV